jgi:peptide subunit release factor 1 (eRF1)
MRKPVALFVVRPAIVRSTRRRLTMVVRGIVAGLPHPTKENENEHFLHHQLQEEAHQ